MGADIIAIDGGSTYSGPHYLGTATAKTARAAVARDLLIPCGSVLRAAVACGSCGDPISRNDITLHEN